MFKTALTLVGFSSRWNVWAEGIEGYGCSFQYS
jgi:hypothetical protein